MFASYSTSSDIISPLCKTMSLSTQSRKWVVNSQADSPLFSILPPEIRLRIFCYVFAPERFIANRDSNIWDPKRSNHYLRHHASRRNRIEQEQQRQQQRRRRQEKSYQGELEAALLAEYLDLPAGDDWCRPGTMGRWKQHPALLRTSRRIFIEARDLLMKMATWQIVEGVQSAPPPYTYMDPNTMARYTANRITSFHLFLEVSALEHGCLFNHLLDMSPARDVRMTVRQCDWPDWPAGDIPDTPYLLQITPYGSGSDSDGAPTNMEEHMESTKDQGLDGTRPPIPPLPFRTGKNSPKGPWGAALSMFPRLERFTMEFEYCEDNLDSLQRVVEWAHRVWTFRLGGHMKGYYLSTEGNPIKKSVWRGVPSQWARTHDGHIDEDNNANTEAGAQQPPEFPQCCARRNSLLRAGIGPKMYNFAVTWTPRKLQPEDGDDPEICGPDTLCDAWIELPNDIMPTEGMPRYENSIKTLDYELLHPSLRSFQILSKMEKSGSIFDIMSNSNSRHGGLTTD